ncbi:hypothetical protein [Mediterraneibacter gnavus]|uniref:hypothetical protein n=1 Tax=Mediterraneibacter gnavus TaxID=33038 RepID=UPI0004645BBC|nr:hypothetical protein [Mediterraneibacter gnavus]
MYKLTKHGMEEVEFFINECKAKRKEILDAKFDTCDETAIPTIDDILSEIGDFIDEEGDYYNCWGVTDNYNSDTLCLKEGIDFEMQ